MQIRPRRGSLWLTGWMVMVAWLSMPIQAESPHSWRPPYGLDRVGAAGIDSGIEAAARATADVIINPVDLGAILVPHEWLLLRDEATAHVKVAAISHSVDEPTARVRVWYAAQPAQTVVTPLPLPKGGRVESQIATPTTPPGHDRDTLRVVIERADGTQLWETSIPAMFVRTPSPLPEFGAVRLKLRYDLPISVRHEGGTFSTLDYDQGWNAALDDVVVCLPGGQRFVFWRGSCYVPFWAGKHNTGLSYEWAETKPPADGFKDCVEPLMDKELRYGRVEIVCSTASLIHVRWTYQSCDFNYKVWGDSATEDFYFTPDGFGTRVLTLQSSLDSDYELSEFIIMTPPGAYPFEVLPKHLVEILFLDGEKRQVEFPYDKARQGEKLASRDLSAIYRARLHKDDGATAIYFHPTERQLPPVVFGGFSDQGQVVTPCYWGSHWPLGRGQTTGGAIDSRIHLTPSHNSVMSWASQQPVPLRESQLDTIDTLGRSRPMRRQTWAWQIGLTEIGDESLIERAQSFRSPPSIELTGARFDDESYSQERRSIGLVAESREIDIRLTPSPVCVNPVFEVAKAASSLEDVSINGVSLAATDYRWDGKLLWLKKTFRSPVQIRIKFAR